LRCVSERGPDAAGSARSCTVSVADARVASHGVCPRAWSARAVERESKTKRHGVDRQCQWIGVWIGVWIDFAYRLLCRYPLSE
jgi:hypothetical protein